MGIKNKKKSREQNNHISLVLCSAGLLDKLLRDKLALLLSGHDELLRGKKILRRQNEKAKKITAGKVREFRQRRKLYKQKQHDRSSHSQCRVKKQEQTYQHVFGFVETNKLEIFVSLDRRFTHF